MSEKSRALVIEKLADLTGKISFPIEEFMDVWAGDFCFEEGGYYLVSEKYIETELDENFETTQVEKIKYKNVPRYSLMFTTCLLYTSDAADDPLRVDPGGRRNIKKKNFFQAEDGIRDS